VTSLVRDHFPLLAFQAGLIAWFLALLWRERSERSAFFLRIWLSLVAGSVAVAWLMSLAGGGKR
jgi:hypothetical protein